jgi:hypothetical protein
MKYRLIESSKLFYNKYTCKVVIWNSLAGIFRSKNYAYAKKQLDILQRNVEAGLPLHNPARIYSNYITFEDFQDACVLYQLIKKDTSDYLIRVEGFDLIIYSNDEEWLERLLKMVEVIEYHRPKDAEHKTFLLANKNLVIHDKPVSYEYQVYLPDRCPTSFANFIKANKDKLKIGSQCLYNLEHDTYMGGLYFWVRDEKVLHLAAIACGNRFKKIVRHVYQPKD